MTQLPSSAAPSHLGVAKVADHEAGGQTQAVQQRVFQLEVPVAHALQASQADEGLETCWPSISHLVVSGLHFNFHLKVPVAHYTTRPAHAGPPAASASQLGCATRTSTHSSR